MRTWCALLFLASILTSLAFAQEPATQPAPGPNAASTVAPPNESMLPAANPTAAAPATATVETAPVSAAPMATPVAPAAVPDATVVATPVVATPVVKVAEPSKLLLDFVKSDLKWQLGFRHEPYNKISGFAVEHLSKALEAKELKPATQLEEGCCKVTLELLQVSTRQAIIKDPGIDVSANITVADAKGKIIFSKGYRGRSGTYFMNTWGHLINNACENMVENMAKDDLLLTVLRSGKLPD